MREREREKETAEKRVSGCMYPPSSDGIIQRGSVVTGGGVAVVVKLALREKIKKSNFNQEGARHGRATLCMPV
ncbi:hypothetical protein L1987_46791 [Smallanthus sonchifolius]|uniref:Uncharacterized protein n=1 Tax=Smallanthus sonchifolius TaxID=185202 RepID=A0ACB9G1C9_9ASTR|nr:hypothetical protein L1987_46791 [Smallanthus sonchifolius]